MFRLAVAGAVGVALLGAAAIFLPWSVVAQFMPGVALMMPLVALTALLVALAAIAAALRAMRHTARLRADVVLLARSIDMALMDVEARTGKEAVTLGDMTNSVAREIEKLSERIATHDNTIADAPAASASNVVPHPSARRSRGMPQTAERPAADPDAIEAAYRKAVVAGQFDISLQPIVSVTRGVAVGFEVFANLPLENGQRIDLRRPAGPTAPAEAAMFERVLITTALQAGRKRLGAASIGMPLHVAVSEPLLADGKELGAVLDMLQFYPDLARSFVPSLPIGLLDPSSRHGQALDMLANRSVRLAAEGWNEAASAGPANRIAGLSFMKIPTNRLLDREGGRRKLAPASTIIDRIAADDLTIIATEVETDEDAVSLIDLGIDLMSGPRFGGPKRFKPDGGRPGKLALI
jgi:cyclic-di-GMP phosphodiesterase TipF (flagellum assembly factor)